MNRWITIWLGGLLGLVLCAGCGEHSTGDEPAAAVRVVATTTIIGEIVDKLAGDVVELHVLLPPGADPHGYIFRPRDMATVADADLIFVNGAGMEGHLERLLSVADAEDKVIRLDQAAAVRRSGESGCSGSHGHCTGHGHAHGSVDPHFWMDPVNMMGWTTFMADVLGERIPGQRALFTARAEKRLAGLRALDDWIKQQVARIPPERRLLVTDHLSFGYFADRYGFEQIGVILPGFDSMAQASAQHLGKLLTVLTERDVPAIFIGMNVNPTLAERMAEDSGRPLVRLHVESLTGPGGTAPDYISFMQYNVRELVAYLAPEPAG